VGSIQNGMVQVRPFHPPAPARTIGIAWRHHYPREATVKRLAELILNNLPAGVEAIVLQTGATANYRATEIEPRVYGSDLPPRPPEPPRVSEGSAGTAMIRPSSSSCGTP
jgi:hypothetical protein